MRFYFHLFNDQDVWDREGVELPDEATALLEGRAAAREMVAHSVREGRLVLSHRIVVCADSNRSIATIYFGDLVDVQE